MFFTNLQSLRPGSDFYKLSADPMQAALQSKNFQAERDAQARVAQSQVAADVARTNAQAGILGALYAQPAEFAKAMGGAFGGYASGLGSIAGAMGNAASQNNASTAMAESARQNALANIASSALGAYGGASNSAMQSWAMNQTGYQKAVADMQAANQNALAGYGVGRASSLASLGNMGSTSSVSMGGGGMGGDGGFRATGTQGPIASGGYGGGGGGFGGSAFKQTGQSPAFLDTLRRDIVSQDGLISREANAGRRQLDDAYYSNRYAPQQMLDQSLRGLQSLMAPFPGQIHAGMNQYYGSLANQRNMLADFSGVLQALQRGFGTTMDSIGAGRNAPTSSTSLWERQLFGQGNPEAPQPQKRQLGAGGHPVFKTLAESQAYARGLR